MRLPFLFLGLLMMVCAQNSFGQAPDEIKQPRILILLDGSSSMLQPWQKDEIRFKTASRIITTLIDSLYKVNDQVEFALRVYGHQHPAQENNCYDTRREVMFSKDNLTQMSLRLASLNSIGVSPIAYSLKEAAENDLVDTRRYNYSLILITDGGESCGGDICDVVKTLLEKKINFKPYIVSLVEYAPLRDQYACLGNYLLTTKEKDIPVTVGSIVDAYTPMLQLKTIIPKIDQPVTSTTQPAIVKTAVPKLEIQKPVEKEPEPIKKEQPIPAIAAKPAPALTPPATPRAAPPSQVATPKVVIPPPPRAQETVTYLSTVSVAGIKLPDITLPLPKLVRVDKFNVPRMQPEPEEKPVVAAVKPPVQTPPVVKPAPPKPVVKPAPKPAEAPPSKPKEPKYNIEREEQKETTLEVYFTDGRGKFYQTTPQIVLLDPKSNAQLHKFHRTVNISGAPQPQKLPEGVYNLTVAGKSNLLVRNVEIKANNKNKIMIQVGKASLRFEYEDDPNQPVSEYSARVKKNFEPGPLFTQLCTQELEYEPGNYHIEISTQPRDHRSVDLDFDALVIIKVEKPGFVHITNTNNIGKVTLYYQLGDQYVQFYKLDVNGDVEKQRLRLQRGSYRVGYNRTPNVPYAQETLKQFSVKTNQTTEVLLD
jgi:hypothetical protein